MDAGTFDYPTVIVKHSNHLPHWYAPNGIYFVTFRLADSLPKHIDAELREERRRILETARARNGCVSDNLLREIETLIRTRIEEELDRCQGACHLRIPSIAELVSTALHFFDRERYELYAWCVMPNHVHTVIRLLGEVSIDEVLHSWKSYTSKKANLLLCRRGTFWESEYYDRLIRDERELEATVDYVLNNPIVAKLEGWPWSGAGCREA